jgi:hypothetical protein
MSDPKLGLHKPASVDDVIYIAKRLRPADHGECDALFALPPELVLPQAASAGRPVWTFHSTEGEPVGVFGVDSVIEVPMLGTIWMVSTPEINNHKREFLVKSRPVVDLLNEQFPVLTNLMDKRNTLHRRWLQWLGFVFIRRIEKWGARSLPFIEFARIKPPCV